MAKNDGQKASYHRKSPAITIIFPLFHPRLQMSSTCWNILGRDRVKLLLPASLSLQHKQRIFTSLTDLLLIPALDTNEGIRNQENDSNHIRILNTWQIYTKNNPKFPRKDRGYCLKMSVKP